MGTMEVQWIRYIDNRPYHGLVWVYTDDALTTDAILTSRDTRNDRFVWDWMHKAEYRGKPEDYPYKFDKILLGQAKRKYLRCNYPIIW